MRNLKFIIFFLQLNEAKQSQLSQARIEERWHGGFREENMFYKVCKYLALQTAVYSEVRVEKILVHQ